MWDTCDSSLTNKLQKLQNQAAKVLTSSSYDTTANYLFEKLGWKNLGIIAKAIMMYKYVNGLCLITSEMFIDGSRITDYA